MSCPLIQSAHFWSSYPKIELSQRVLDTYANQTRNKEVVFYRIFKFLSFFHRNTLQSIAHIVEPLPGAGKASCIGRQVKRLAYRIFYLFWSMITFVGGGLPFAVLSQKIIFGTLSTSAIIFSHFLLQILCGYILLFFISLPFYCCAHYCKPMVRYSSTISTQSHPLPTGIQDRDESLLHIRSFNLGCTYTTTEIVGDLRPAEQRIDEISDWIENGMDQPDIICFQEVFHQEARERLHERMKNIYPYVLYSIAPHFMGLDSGFMIASKLPIEEFSFRPFNSMMIGPERWTNRGLAKMRINIGNSCFFDIYVTHLQALLGKARAEMRLQQMQWIIHEILKDQKEDPSSRFVLVGDMNAPERTVWGEYNDEDESFHSCVQEESFIDLYSNVLNKEKWVAGDTPDGVEVLKAPTGTWNSGPWEKKGLLKFKEMFEQIVNGVTVKRVDQELQEQLSQCYGQWGTPAWSSSQQACSARFDRAYLQEICPKDYLEIRRVKVSKETESAPSDHLPIDLLLETKKPLR